MSEQIILVPRISTLPEHEARARLLLRWLVKREIVAELPSTCGALGNGMAHAIGAGARRIVERPELLPFGQALNGLQIVSKRCIYTPTEGFLEEAGCPECRQEIGEALFDSLDEWMPGDTDNFSCPQCGHEDDVNGFLFLQLAPFPTWASSSMAGDRPAFARPSSTSLPSAWVIRWRKCR